MGARGRARRFEQGEPSAAALVAQAARSLLDRFQAELVGIKRPRPVKVLGWEPGGHVAVLEHARPYRSRDRPVEAALERVAPKTPAGAGSRRQRSTTPPLLVGASSWVRR